MTNATVGADLPISTPSAEGIDANGILGLIDELEDQVGIDPHSLMVLRHGRVVAQGWWRPYTADRPTLLYSLSKSFTASALGLAVGEGLVDLDVPVAQYLPGVAVHPALAGVTLRHLVSMRSGHRHDTWAAADLGDDPVAGFLALGPEDEPGTTFCYNQPPIMTISAVLEAVSGESLTGFLRPRLLDPLGIGDTTWLRSARGIELGFSGLFATTDAVARLGQLYLDDGVWKGRRLLDEGWTNAAGRAHADTSTQTNPDWRQGYGLGFWRSRHGFRGDGAYGQFCLVLPEQDMVVAITSATTTMQDVLDTVWRHLLPAVDSGRASAADDARLGERTARLELPAVRGAGWRSDLPSLQLLPYGERCPAQPGLTSIDLAGDHLVLHERDAQLLVSTDPDAGKDADGVVAAGTSATGALVLDVMVVSSPHRLSITADLDARTFTADWHTQPLHGWLRELAPSAGEAPASAL